MGKRIKKGTTGDAVKYCTRSYALKKLKLSLKEFRRLCILKGVFPKEPKRKFKGQNKTYYLVKDIKYLAHDDLLNKFREINAFQRKINKAKQKRNKFDYKKLKENKPKYSIQHIIKERYPRFIDALNDLDDALSLINLFAILPKHELHNIRSEEILMCKRLSREFILYLALSKGLKRAFISIKGIYLNTEIMGNDVTWLMPFSMPQKLPFEVDYEVMNSFLELYLNLMKLINFKLYKDIGLEYPPNVKESDSLFFGYNSLIIKDLQKQISHSNEENKETIDTNLIDSEEFQKIKKKNERLNMIKMLFKNFVFFISREVPKEIFELAISSMGGLYGDDSDNSAFTEDSPEITHFIVDRNHESIEYIKNKEYVQPQWIIDCLNSCSILPTSDYSPSKTELIIDKVTGKKKYEVVNKLPPHTSPFYEYINEKKEYYPKDINKEDLLINNKEINENIENDKQEIDNKNTQLNEMLLSKNKRKLLQKIRENNERKFKKRKIE